MILTLDNMIYDGTYYLSWVVLQSFRFILCTFNLLFIWLRISLADLSQYLCLLYKVQENSRIYLMNLKFINLNLMPPFDP